MARNGSGSSMSRGRHRAGGGSQDSGGDFPDEAVVEVDVVVEVTLLLKPIM